MPCKPKTNAPRPRPHVLLVLRGFAADGPGRLVLSTLRCFSAGQVRISAFVLQQDGPLGETLAAEIARLGGQVRTLEGRWSRLHHAHAALDGACSDWNPDVLHAHLVMADMVGRAVARKRRLPYFVTEHGVHSWGEGPPFSRGLVKPWYARSLPAGGRILAISKKVRRDLLGEGIPAKRVLLVPNGIPAENFAVATPEERRAARRQLGLPAEAGSVALVLGGLHGRKAPGVALQALELLLRESGDPRLVYAGSGPLEAALGREAQQRCIGDRAHFLGQLADPALALAAADLLLHPAGDEPFGLAVAEALASGLPVAARAGGGADELLPPGSNSLAVDGGEARSWAAAWWSLQALLDQEPGKTRGACRQWALDNHDIERTAKRLVQVYRGAAMASSRMSQKRCVSARREN